MAGLPTGTVTFLFTDLEVSTRLWDQEPEAMRVALARHDELLRDAVTGRGGEVVKGRGDGVLAVFATAEEAIDAAIDVQVAMSTEAWALSVPLRVRVGIHSGVAELRDGDYFGTAVNRAARLEAAAHGGQIVCSRATADLVRDSLPGTIELLDLGEYTLRDLARSERIFQVVAAGLERDFAPLVAPSSMAGNLAAPVTSFVGRDDELDRVIGLLGDARLVTLSGTGGVGKTRLAVEVGIEARPRFADGVWVCELAAADDADAMVQVVASTLGCVQHPGLSLSESIVEYLKVRGLLLVLDNCEHLLDDAGAFAEAVVRGCPEVTVLATSREALEVSGERVMRVRSLAIPEPSADDADLLASPSVELFRDRVRDAGADDTWDERQWAAVGEICRRVDGIPLAIELAAARAVSMNPIDIASHLDERFRLLTGRRRSRIERHQTLRATVEWSYQLLGPDDRRVFDRLGSFAGSFDEAAAVAVAGDDDAGSWTVTDALADLVAKSMIHTESGPDGGTRYVMLETLRQFAREQLDVRGEIDRCLRAHAVHLCNVARAAALGAIGPDDDIWQDRLRADIDNIRATIGWALDQEDHADYELGLFTLASLEAEGEVTPDLGLAALAAQAVPLAMAAPPELRVPVLTLAAYGHWHQGHLDEARRLAERALLDGIAASTPHAFAPLALLVSFEMSVGSHDKAFEHAEAARARMDAMDDDWEVAWHLSGIAAFEAMVGRIDAALADSARALDIAQRLGNHHALVNAVNARVWALQRDHPEDALALAEQFLDTQRGSGVARGVMPGLMSLTAGLRARLGDDQGALPLLHDALAIARDDGTKPQAGAVAGFALNPLCRIGSSDVAARLIGALDRGALADVARFPGTADARRRTLERIIEALGVRTTEQLVAEGAAMTYDQLTCYALEHLGQGTTDPSTPRDR